MADHIVGENLTNWLIDTYNEDIALVITTLENNIYKKCLNDGVKCRTYQGEEDLVNYLSENNIRIDLGIMLWWPKIITQKLISVAQHGFINTHPSLLPYNRGKHYNFWTLKEETPYGVSLHFVNEGVDTGDIITQSVIEYTWEDNAESLYNKSCLEIQNLFKEKYSEIRSLKIKRKPQNLEEGSTHYARELEPACQIILDKEYKARDLINLLRARTFNGHPSCWFIDKENKYEIRIQINKK